MELSPEQHKQIVVANLNKAQSWYFGYGDKPDVIFALPQCTMESGDVADQLQKHLRLKNVFDVNETHRLHDEHDLYGKAIKHNSYVIVDTEEHKVQVVGDENLKLLANAGVEFPGAEFHRSKHAGKKWTPSV